MYNYYRNKRFCSRQPTDIKQLHPDPFGTEMQKKTPHISLHFKQICLFIAPATRILRYNRYNASLRSSVSFRTHNQS